MTDLILTLKKVSGDIEKALLPGLAMQYIFHDYNSMT